MLQNILIIISSVVFSGTSQILLKIGAGQVIFGTRFTDIISIVMNKFIILGVLFQVIALLIWLLVLKKVEVSFAYPFVGLGFILVMAYGYFFLQEGVGILRVAGITFIIVGLICISFSYGK
jgi:multidrug transporter EmrE-like cation transporter